MNGKIENLNQTSKLELIDATPNYGPGRPWYKLHCFSRFRLADAANKTHKRRMSKQVNNDVKFRSIGNVNNSITVSTCELNVDWSFVLKTGS